MCTRYPIINRVSELKVHIELTRFVQPEKIEIDANERAVNEKSPYCFFVCTTFDSFLNDFSVSKTGIVPLITILYILVFILFTTYTATIVSVITIEYQIAPGFHIIGSIITIILLITIPLISETSNDILVCNTD